LLETPKTPLYQVEIVLSSRTILEMNKHGDITMDNQQIRQGKQDLLPVPEMDRYWIDIDGNIYSTKKYEIPRKLTPHKHKGNGAKLYMRLRLIDKLFLQHRIVASIHIGRQLLGNEVVNHLDGDTLNNKLCNLEVVSQRENVQHAVENNLYCSGSAWYKAHGKQP
jgi:hypothetical protein